MRGILPWVLCAVSMTANAQSGAPVTGGWWTVPVFSGLGVAAVFGLAALWHHVDFRRTGDPPVFTARHVFTYGAATFLSATLDEFWKPPLWQRLGIYVLAIALAWAVLRLFRKRSPP